MDLNILRLNLFINMNINVLKGLSPEQYFNKVYQMILFSY
jgi:hypothetical protein